MRTGVKLGMVAAWIGWMAVLAPAQNLIQAPDLQCIKNDTLFWNLPVNACGPFQAYLIFGALNPAGPFNVLAAITDPAQTSWYHALAGNQTWFYYMQTNQTCPGWIRLSSDTLSSKTPDPVPIRSASVINGQVVLTWDASSDPQVDRYIIYRNTPGGTVPVDTVYGTTSWTDAIAQPGTGSQYYYILAADPCGNTSLFDLGHQTIFTIAQANACARSITLDWNPYINWPAGVGAYLIDLSVSGAPATTIDTLSGTSTTFVYTGADDAEEYCFIIRAVEAGSGVEAWSNEVCLDPDLVQPPSRMAMSFITVGPSGSPAGEWVWETYAELTFASVERRQSDGSFLPVIPVSVSSPLLPSNAFADPGTDAGVRQEAYRITATDDCGMVWTTLPASPAFLQATALPGLQNALSWSPMVMDAATIEEQEVFEVRGSQQFSLGTVGPSVYIFLHALDAANPPVEPVCYLVETTYRVQLPDGSAPRRYSRSNVACTSQDLRIWVPNAFAPRGLNTLFKPVLSFLNGGSYHLEVFDRWGERVFVTSDPGQGWDGKIKGGQDALPGVYVWTIRLVEADGKETARQGTVTLLR